MRQSFPAIPSEVMKLSEFEKLFDLLESSKRVVALTGAGVSTLSGIPDFRSSGGLYSQKFGSIKVEELLDIDFFRANPDEFYKWAKDGWYKMHEFQPNVVHKALALMEEKGILTDGIFTQNIDALHQRAGSKKIYELHGSIASSYCLRCQERFTYEEIEEQVRVGVNPVCPHCGGTIKPNIVFYGEGLDAHLLMQAEKSFKECDLCLVLGSSLVVNPAATLPFLSVRSGKHVVIVNRDKTYLDDYADLRFTDLKTFSEAMVNWLRLRK
ncbi:MAG: NAD-dependent protein deacylase [Spirochaetales bacterium]|nr:NAD-dependent protein deacylase [Candidatus Physcosoma equi]